MPTLTEERLRKIEAALGTRLADKGAKLDGAARRRTSKRLRRTQRKRRLLTAAATRKAGASAKEATPSA